jgi:hypothetical protein
MRAGLAVREAPGRDPRVACLAEGEPHIAAVEQVAELEAPLQSADLNNLTAGSSPL